MSKEILSALLGRVYKIPAEQITGLLEKPDNEILATILSADEERVRGWKEAERDRFNNGRKKSKAEFLNEFEAKLKEHYGVEGDEIGTELIDKIIALKAPESGSKKMFTPEEIRKHPEFLKFENDFKQKEKAIRDEYENKLSERERSYKKEKVGDRVRAIAIDLLDGLKPLLSKDVEKAKNQKNDYVRDLLEFDFEEIDGQLVPLDKEGQPMKDKHGYTISFSDFAKQYADKRFDYETPGSGKSTPGAEQRPINVGKTSIPFKAEDGSTKDLPLPKNVGELASFIRDDNFSPEQKQAVMTAYKEAHAE